MKKWLFIFLTLLIIAIGSVYLMIPSSYSIVRVTGVNANIDGVFRQMTADLNIRKWWPGTITENSSGDTVFEKDGIRFSAPFISFRSFTFVAQIGADSINTTLIFIPVYKDSFNIEWNTPLNAGYSPLSRINTYFLARKIRLLYPEINAKLVPYINDTKNMYGINIRKEKVPFENFISVKKQFDHSPTSEEVYKMINQLTRYASAKGAATTYPPILNIVRNENNKALFDTHVALATDTRLSGDKEISYKWMLKGGNILVTEVKGGNAVIDQSLQEMTQYINDHEMTIMAIPFQMLTTDRLKEPDSSKWITRLYYPVM